MAKTTTATTTTNPSIDHAALAAALGLDLVDLCAAQLREGKESEALAAFGDDVVQRAWSKLSEAHKAQEKAIRAKMRSRTKRSERPDNKIVLPIVEEMMAHGEALYQERYASNPDQVGKAPRDGGVWPETLVLFAAGMRHPEHAQRAGQPQGSVGKEVDRYKGKPVNLTIRIDANQASRES